jgi:putative ABC transport system permease protein
MKTSSLALRNLLRNRRRSQTTLAAMIIGLCSILLFGGFSKAITYGLQTSFVQRSSHLQIQHKDYFLYGTGNPTEYGITDYQRIIDTVKEDATLSPMLNVVTPTLVFGGIAGNFSAGVSRTVIGVGMVAEDQDKLREWNDYELILPRRSSPLTGASSDAAMVGNGLARVLRLCGPLKVNNCPTPTSKSEQSAPAVPSDIAALSAIESPTVQESAESRVEILATSARGAPNVAGVSVVKAEDQGLKDLDDIFIAMHLSQAQRLIYGQSEPRVTAISLQLKHTNQMPAARARLKEILATSFKGQTLEVHDFAVLNPLYGQSIAMFGAIFMFISLLIGAIVLFTVGNTMSMAVVERTVEIGTLRSIGLRRNGIKRLFVCEGFLLGLMGSILGVSIALLIAFVLNRSGLTWIAPGRVEPVPLVVNVWGEAKLIMTSAVGLLFVATLSAWWPARKASRMNIVDALRHV